MVCPNCGKEMKNNSFMWEVPDFGGTADDSLFELIELFNCENCNIEYNGHEIKKNKQWIIPKELLPTQKQIKTILFINYHLDMDIQPITKYQCWNEINKYFDKACQMAEK